MAENDGMKRNGLLNGDVTQNVGYRAVIMLSFITKNHKPAALVIISVQFADITSHNFWVMRMKIS